MPAKNICGRLYRACGKSVGCRPSLDAHPKADSDDRLLWVRCGRNAAAELSLSAEAMCLKQLCRNRGLRLRRRQYVPGGERVHVVPPVCDPPVFDPDDRAEPIVVLSACGKNLTVDLVFDNDAVGGLVCNQLIGGAKRYVVNIAAKLGHQGGSPADNSRPAGEVVENLVDNIFGDDVKEVLAIN